MVDPATVATSAVVSALVALGSTEYQLRRKRSFSTEDEVQEWYSEAVRIVSETQSMWRQKYVQPMNENRTGSFEETQRKMKLTASQIRGHIGEGQSLDVDDEVIEALRSTAEKCESVSNLTIHMNVTDEFERKGNEVIDQAEEAEQLALEHI